MNLKVFDSFPDLQTERLFLKELKNPNLGHLLEITSFNGRANNRKEVLELIDNLALTFSKKEGLTWGIYFEQELIGTIGFYRGFKNDSGEIGYVIRKQFRRKGFIREAVHEVLDFGFNKMGLAEITAYTTDDNSASISLIKSLNFEKTQLFSDNHRRYELQKEKWN